MKVLVISQYFWPESFLINSVVADLANEGLQVTVLSGKPNYPEGEIFENYRAGGVLKESFHGATVLRVPLLPRRRGKAAHLVANYLSFLFSACTFGVWQLRGRTFDVVLVYAPSPLLQALAGVLLARLKRAPLLVWVQDLWPASLEATGHIRNRRILAMVQALVQTIYRSSDRVLIQSEGFRDPIAALMKPEDHCRIHYLPNSIPLDPGGGAASPSAEALAARIGSRASVVLAGNLGKAQALETVLSAAEQVPEVTIFLIGSGSMESWLRQQITSRALQNVELAGRFAPADMSVIFNAAHALLVSLRGEPILRLTVPNKVQTYLDAGRPIIASLDGEAARIIEEAGAGLTCPAEDASALAEALRTIATMPRARLEAMGTAGQMYFKQHFTPERLTFSLISHFEQVIYPTREQDA